MNSFKDFNIKLDRKRMSGDKIKMAKVINMPIIVLDYRLDDSKYSRNRSGKCLSLQIKIEGEKHVIFTGSDVLIEQIQKVPEEGFPFETAIIREGERFEFS